MVVELFHYFTALLLRLGYAGVLIGMFFQSTFIPFPSEIVMLPAGAAIQSGDMDFVKVLLSAVTGNVLGASFNYIVAMSLGRMLVVKYGRYVGFNQEKLLTVEAFFAHYGAWSMLIGRLVPMLRQFISLPAGLAKMNFIVFALFTALGSAIWIVISVGMGYLLASYPQLLSKYLIVTVSGGILITVSVCYVIRRRYGTKSKMQES